MRLELRAELQQVVDDGLSQQSAAQGVVVPVCKVMRITNRKCAMPVSPAEAEMERRVKGIFRNHSGG